VPEVIVATVSPEREREREREREERDGGHLITAINCDH
jgi:hypothetical protein